MEPEVPQKRNSKFVFISIAVLVVGTSFLVGLWFGYDNRPGVEKVLHVLGKEPTPEFSAVDMSLFWDVWAKLEEKFVDSKKLDRQKLVYGAITGLVQASGDPYTTFFPPVESKAFQDDIKGSFEGIGAEIGMRQGVLTVVAPLKESPAEKAGLKAGDKILKINDKITSDLALDEAVRLIRGPKGETVTLVILREGDNNPREIKVVRDTIKVPIVTTEKKNNGIFVIQLHQFTENASFEFRKAIEEFYKSGSKKLILDLRNDPGGYLTVAVDVASWYTEPGDIIVRERLADGSEEVHRSSGYKLLENVPSVVLVNEGSASASEIVAGALRDLRKIPLIGMKSFGKGSVQELVNMPENSSLKVTIAKWLTPNGTEIDGKGFEPDIKVEIPKDKDGQISTTTDVVMEKAVEYLKLK